MRLCKMVVLNAMMLQMVLMIQMVLDSNGSGSEWFLIRMALGSKGSEPEWFGSNNV